MAQPTLNRDQIRELDRRAADEFGVATLLLMENAGRSVADRIMQFGVFGPVTVCCGGGNNGGDGLVAARHLHNRGVSVDVMLFAERDKLTSDTFTNYQIVLASGIKLRQFAAGENLTGLFDETSLLIDALVGIGFVAGQPLRSPLKEAIVAMNGSGKPIVAIDVPSGLDCNTGQASHPTIQAMHTCTFVARKPGFNAVGAEAYTGAVHVLEIGAPRRLVVEMLGGRNG